MFYELWDTDCNNRIAEYASIGEVYEVVRNVSMTDGPHEWLKSLEVLIVRIDEFDDMCYYEKRTWNELVEAAQHYYGETFAKELHL